MGKEVRYRLKRGSELTMEEIAYAVRRDPDRKTVVNDVQLDVYDIGSHRIGFTLVDPDFRAKLVERGRRVGQSNRTKKETA